MSVIYEFYTHSLNRSCTVSCIIRIVISYNIIRQNSM